MFKNNWQLQEDTTPFFIKYGYNWVFNGIPKNQRTEVMSQTWDLVKHNYDENHILNKLVHKDEWCKTTSRKFKEDILRIFDNKDMVCLELGSCRGDTTRIFAECFKRVHSFERSDENIKYIKERCSDVDNIEYNQMDVYSSDFKIPNDIDVAFVDAGHSTDLVLHDIKRLLENNSKMILIFDDYGQADGSIKTAVMESQLEVSRHIGEYNGITYNRLTGESVTLTGREGVICNL